MSAYVFVDAICPACGAEVRAQLVDALPGGPDVFTHYPHRTGDRKGWCNKGTGTAAEFSVQAPLDLEGVSQ